MKKRYTHKHFILCGIVGVLSAAAISGCAVQASADIDQGKPVQISVVMPENLTDLQGTPNPLEWIRLDTLDTYPDLRLSWEDTLGIIPFGSGSKNGVFYINLNGDQTGNGTLRLSFRNKAFIENYWSNAEARASLAEAVRDTYADASDSELKALYQGINGYFNILPDYSPNYSNLDEPLSRGQFLAGVYRAENPVPEENDYTKAFQASEEDKEKFGDSEYSAYVGNMEYVSYLTSSDSSLNEQSVNEKISRAEAIYTLVNMYFKEDFAGVDGTKESAYEDCYNGGDIAGKRGFIEVDSKTGDTTEKTYWKAYELEYALENPDKGMPESLYNAMVVAYNLGLIDGSESRWDEALTKGELIELLIRVYEIQNEREGYLINATYGNGEATTGKGTEGGITDTANNGGDAAVSGLVEIFSPSKYLNEQTFEVTRTQEQYDTLMAFDITRETHYVDEIIDFIVCDINFQGEENVTDEDVRGMIQQWVEDGRKVEIGDLEGEGSDSWYTIIPFEGTWYATTTVNIRSTPTTEEDNIVGQLAFAEAVEADGATSDAKFVRIVYEGEYAFVSASLLQDTKPERQTQPSNQGGSTGGSGSGGSSENNDTQGSNGTGGDSGGDVLGQLFPENGQGNGAGYVEPDWDKIGEGFGGN